ncbi:MAG: TIGR01777 family oxidoreductase [Dissulfurispiraceae bacterium]
MNIVITGATGFIGGNLTKSFADRNWKVIPINREDLRLGSGSLAEKIEGSDAVINLAGAPVGTKWTEQYKKILYDSRIETTKRVVNALKKIRQQPNLFISTSAIGIYSSKGSHTEESKDYADNFLGRLALDWEHAAMEANEFGIRTVIFRCGIVIGRNGGALQKMLLPFRLGLGGIIGDGKQSFSWIHIEDLVNAYLTAIEDKRFQGIYNLTAPNPTTNKGLTKALGHAVHRPTFLHIPSYALKLQFGEGASMLLEGQRVLPERLLKHGFKFRFSGIQEAVDESVK